MKKTFATLTLMGVMASTSVLANTEGNYIGISLNYTDLSDTKRGTGASFGVNYRHALNFGGLFIAPGIFYDANEANEVRGNNRDSIEYSYGLTLDTGYDITEKVSAYGRIGYTEARSKTFYKNSTHEGFLLGAGVKYSVTDAVDVGVEYEVTALTNGESTFDRIDEFNSSYRVAKLNLSYNF